MSLISDIFKTIFGRTERPSVKTEVKQEEATPFIKTEVVGKPARKKRAESLKTKTYQVKKHLIEKGSIDSWTAIQLYGATRLSAIIFKLRNSGYIIDSIPNTVYDRNQEICNYTTYKYISYNGTN
jgi:hypothetical protein